MIYTSMAIEDLCEAVINKEKAIVVSYDNDGIEHEEFVRKEINKMLDSGIDMSTIESIEMVENRDLVVVFKESWETMDYDAVCKIREFMISRGNTVTAEAYIASNSMWREIENESIKAQRRQLKKNRNTDTIVCMYRINKDIRKVYIKVKRDIDGNIRSAIMDNNGELTVLSTRDKDADRVDLINEAYREVKSSCGYDIRKVIIDNCIYNIEGFCETEGVDLKLCAMY